MCRFYGCLSNSFNKALPMRCNIYYKSEGGWQWNGYRVPSMNRIAHLERLKTLPEFMSTPVWIQHNVSALSLS